MKTANLIALSVALATSLLSSTVFAGSPPEMPQSESITQYLQAFHKNPFRMMQRLPSYVDENGNAYPRGYITENKFELRKMVKFRSEVRERIIRPEAALSLDDPATPTTPPTGVPEETAGNKDNPEILVEPGAPMMTNLIDMHNTGLNRFKLPTPPWADSYWPIYRGLIAYRYAGGGGRSKDWSVNYGSFSASPPEYVAASGNLSAINHLSPAEKYDYIMGDSAFTLTRFSWAQGQRYFEKYGVVPGWMGICHGWSAAAHMMAKYPMTPITVRAVNGTPVTLYPNDVKALQSMLWANASPKARFVGHRCEATSPARNRHGRILDEKCFDVSPRTWHLAVTNQMGLNKRSFVMDATYDHQVWNFPIAEYKFRYFNPQTWEEFNTPTPAMVAKESFRVDKFPEFRDQNTKKIIGVYMDVTYTVEIEPTTGRPNDEKPPMKTARFVYDLELDENNNIIGGEWYSNVHPDFIWTFDKDSQAATSQDIFASTVNWSVNSPVPAAWTEAARKASRRGAPLESFVTRLAPQSTVTEPDTGTGTGGNTGGTEPGTGTSNGGTNGGTTGGTSGGTSDGPSTNNGGSSGAPSNPPVENPTPSNPSTPPSNG
jgi:hypothetical protein